MLVTVLLSIVLALLLLLVGFCFWHIIVPVPFVPTSNVMVQQMVELANVQPGETVYDLGAGDARLLIAAKRRQPTCKAMGYEVLPSAWLQGRLRIWWSKVPITLRRRSFFKANLSDADVIFAYLFPKVMQQLEQKFATELTPGTRIISHAFAFANKQPLQVHTVQDGRRERKIYVYEW